MADSDHNASDPKAGSNLAGRGLTALKWNMFGSVGGLLLQFAIGVLLARILGPGPYGTIAVAWLILGLGNLLAEGGMGAALVQKNHICDSDVREVFSTQVIAGVLLAGLVFLSAGPMADWFGNPHAADVLRAMALVLLIQPFGLTSAALMRRELHFKRLQINRIASYLAGYLGVGLPLALTGQGVWSLVFAQLAQVGIFSVSIYLQQRHPMWPMVAPRRAGLLGFGAAVAGSNLSSWAISYMDTLIIGRFFQPAQLGLYNRAYSLLAMPMNALASSVQSVLFAACSRNQHDLPGLRRTYLGALAAVSLIILPPFAVMAVVPEALVLGVYGEKWVGAVELVTPLALAMGMNAVLAVNGPLLTAIGLVRREFGVQLLVLAGMLLLLFWAADSGQMLWMAWAVCAAYALRLLLLTAITLRALHASAGSWLVTMVPACCLAILMALFARGFDRLLAGWLQEPAWRLPALIIACALVYIGMLVMARSLIVQGAMRDALSEMAPHLPRPFRVWAGVSA